MAGPGPLAPRLAGRRVAVAPVPEPRHPRGRRTRQGPARPRAGGGQVLRREPPQALPRRPRGRLLPAAPQNTLRAFYDDVVDRLAQSEGLPESADAAALLDRLVGPDDWRRALDAVRSTGAAVKEIKQVVERRVKRLFGEANDDVFARPLLPSMELLLRAASGDGTAESKVDPRWLDQFRSRLAGLLPVGFVPDGSGPLKILVVHPASESDGRAADFLSQELNLPPRVVPECRAVDTDSITVVFFRSGMNLTDISEVRGVLSLWAEARDAGGEDDFLHWRQRLGHRDDWLVSTEQDRQRILHRLLCALWNGHVAAEGPAGSPHLVRISLQEGESATMTLRLEGFDGSLSSWAGLLRAYERWALLDEGRSSSSSANGSCAPCPRASRRSRRPRRRSSPTSWRRWRRASPP